MTHNRRDFLLFLASIGCVAVDATTPASRRGVISAATFEELRESSSAGSSSPAFNFTPVRGALPLDTDGLSSGEQLTAYRRHTLRDELVLPEGFTYDVVAMWGEPCGDSRIGYNNDYLSFVETEKGAGFLTINFEYVSPLAWMQTYTQVVGKSLPVEAVRAGIRARGAKDSINAFALKDDDELKRQIGEICREALVDQGLGVIFVRQTKEGKWARAASRVERRITGLSGLTNERRRLRATGAARAVFRKTKGQGYIDPFGERIIGSFANCAGGTTPWGTILSGEENFQSQVPEVVHPDGTSYDPSDVPFTITERTLAGQGNVFGLAGNKYGWIVEVDPSNPADYGTKHTWLGRYRHEAVGVRVERGRPLAFYSGCDRTGGHLYKFVSRDSVRDPQSKSNSRLLENGMLYAARFDPNGTGRWIALNAQTPVAPDDPKQVAGGVILLPRRDGVLPSDAASSEPRGIPTNREAKDADRSAERYLKAKTIADTEAFKRRFKTLGDLYTGNAEERQGAILIDAHYAANAVGATCTARPEDTEIAPDGSLYIAFTSGVASQDGGSDNRIFRGPKGEIAYEFGFIMRLVEDKSDPASLTFTWKMMAMGGEPAEGGAGFSNPDNLLVDKKGNLWVVTDMYAMNRAVPTRTDETGKPISAANLISVFGNNAILFMPTIGEEAGRARLFAVAPMEAELTGAFFTPDEQTLFLCVQHPGELNGVRRANASEQRQFAMKTTDGKEFIQTRDVPIGSNFPGGKRNDPPRPVIVAVRRVDKCRNCPTNK